jgi:hypothetical protein
MAGIGNLVSAETGTFTDNLSGMPTSAQAFQSISAVTMTRSVRARMSSSLALGRNSPGLMIPLTG